jgi:hypothetical protein
MQKYGMRRAEAQILSYPWHMSIDTILLQIDSEIARLTQARALLSSIGNSTAVSTGTTTKSAPVKAAKRKKRVLSPEARKRIADAQRKRWAAQKAKPKGK